MAKYRKYSKEFQLQAAKLVTEQGYSYKKAAQRLGGTAWSIRQWVKKFRQSGQLPPADQTQPDRTQAVEDWPGAVGHAVDARGCALGFCSASESVRDPVRREQVDRHADHRPDDGRDDHRRSAQSECVAVEDGRDAEDRTDDQQRDDAHRCRIR